MAIDAFNVTRSDVLDRIPAGTSQVGSGTEPVSETDVDEAIDDKASEMAGVLERYSVDAADLSDEAERQVQNAIRDGAAAEVLKQFGHVGEIYEKFVSNFEDAKEELRDSANLDRDADRIDSTVDTSDDVSAWSRDNFAM